jgi:AcrR family transcriptional regulator
MSVQQELEGRPLRADAARNREKILTAAGVVFARQGLEATLDEIAAEAGVGVGTVYRRFPDKESLIAALFENAVDELAELATTASEFKNSWDGLVWFLEESLQRQCENRGLRDVFTGTDYFQERILPAKQRIAPLIANLMERAQLDGYLRADVVELDIPMIDMMISSLGCVTNQTSPDLWRRYLNIMIDGLKAQRSTTTELGSSPGESVVSSALRSCAKGPRRN